MPNNQRAEIIEDSFFRLLIVEIIDLARKLTHFESIWE